MDGAEGRYVPVYIVFIKSWLCRDSLGFPGLLPGLSHSNEIGTPDGAISQFRI